MNEQLCTMCETGKIDFMINKNSIFCTYINCLSNNGCAMYIPVEEGRESNKNELK